MKSLAILILAVASAMAQKPVAELPRVYIDSTYNLPTGGATCAAHNATQFSACLTSTNPGDVIVLDAGVTYTGNFYLPSKANSNNQWIYVISSALANLPVGVRVSPAVAANMPKIVTPAASSAIYVRAGANHWRFSGIEIYSASTYHPASYPAGINFGYALVQDDTMSPLPDSIWFDRCYLHGDPTHDLQRGVAANWSNGALVDSYISEIYQIGAESQGYGAWQSPGPFKIVNNYISASTENLMFGGAGGNAQPYIPSDIEIRNNYLYKPLAWVDLSVNKKLMVVKNLFETKNSQRVLFDGNTLENNWANAQVGFAFLLTVLNSQSGAVARVQDITVTNNVLLNVASGFETMTKDWLCHPPACTDPGDATRINITNNLITFYDPTLPGGARNTGFELNPGQDFVTNYPSTTAINGVPHDVVFQHNTMVPAASKACFASVIVALNGGQVADGHTTNNIWIQDNSLCREVEGVGGQATLDKFLSDPSTPPNDITQRFYGNVMYVVPGDKTNTYPAHNWATPTAFTFDPLGNMLTPVYIDTTDGRQAGYHSAGSVPFPTNSTSPKKPSGIKTLLTKIVTLWQNRK